MASEEKSSKTEAAPAPSQPTPSSGGGSKLPAILAIVNILFTLGIGAVVFIQFQKDKHRESVSDISTEGEKTAESGEAKAGEHGEAKPAEHGEAKSEHGEAKPGEHGEGEAKKENASKIITLEQFTVNLSTTVGTPPHFARVMIAVEVGSDNTSQELTQKMPQARNAILDLFNSKRPSDLQTGEGRNFLKEEIRNALNSFLVTGKVKGVFFSNFTIN